MTAKPETTGESAAGAHESAERNAQVDANIDARIAELKQRLGRKLAIAAHHYQDPAIVSFADLVGDSYRLAVEAARTDAEYIVLCGVGFMAESVAVLARSDQTVLMPVVQAGCPMAGMITPAQAREVCESAGAVPVVYMNSTTALKAFAGEKGGSVCTSGNAENIVRAYLDEGRRVFFAPDRNLGTNIARSLGIPEHDTFTVGAQDLDGSNPARLKDLVPANAKIIFWDGFCPVHRQFTPADVRQARECNPDTHVLVHPECSSDVAKAADKAGSTEMLLREIAEAPDGAVLAIGTESGFVDRMIAAWPGKNISHLRKLRCSDMALTDRNSLLQTLEAIVRHEETGAPLDRIEIPEIDRENARKALAMMVTLTEQRREKLEAKGSAT
ncbi:MAG: quinolinate synthase subunit A [Treponema sp.]|nr:MAG: quinolinate synthase subunit A [Treponema sp.]